MAVLSDEKTLRARSSGRRAVRAPRQHRPALSHDPGQFLPAQRPGCARTADGARGALSPAREAGADGAGDLGGRHPAERARVQGVRRPAQGEEAEPDDARAAEPTARLAILRRRIQVDPAVVLPLRVPARRDRRGHLRHHDQHRLPRRDQEPRHPRRRLHRMSRAEVLSAHASCAILTSAGTATVFLGASGAGKTEAATFWGERNVHVRRKELERRYAIDHKGDKKKATEIMGTVGFLCQDDWVHIVPSGKSQWDVWPSERFFYVRSRNLLSRDLVLAETEPILENATADYGAGGSRDSLGRVTHQYPDERLFYDPDSDTYYCDRDVHQIGIVVMLERDTEYDFAVRRLTPDAVDRLPAARRHAQRRSAPVLQRLHRPLLAADQPGRRRRPPDRRVRGRQARRRRGADERRRGPRPHRARPPHRADGNLEVLLRRPAGVRGQRRLRPRLHAGPAVVRLRARGLPEAGQGEDGRRVARADGEDLRRRLTTPRGTGPLPRPPPETQAGPRPRGPLLSVGTAAPLHRYTRPPAADDASSTTNHRIPNAIAVSAGTPCLCRNHTYPASRMPRPATLTGTAPRAPTRAGGR